MADLCQSDYEAVRPDRYFPETFRTGECKACGGVTFVARVTAREARDAEHAALMARPVIPERPEKLRGPEMGARVRYTSTGQRHGQTGTVTARSYVWAPDHMNGPEHRGYRRYEDSVVRFDDGGTLVILDKDLVLITEPHTFRSGRPQYGQRPEQCYYCWGPANIHESED